MKWETLPDGALVGRRDATAADSADLDGIIRLVPDPLLKQMMIANVFHQKFYRQDVSLYDKYQDLMAEQVTLPFLKEPLHAAYLAAKSRIENPVIYTETVLKEMQSSSVHEIFADLLKNNRNKVIYVDFWATWCAPCLAEFPNSKKLETELPITVRMSPVCTSASIQSRKNTRTSWINMRWEDNTTFYLKYKAEICLRF